MLLQESNQQAKGWRDTMPKLIILPFFFFVFINKLRCNFYPFIVMFNIAEGPYIKLVSSLNITMYELFYQRPK